MTMFRDKPPGKDHEPEYVRDAPDDAAGYNRPAWNIGRGIFFAFMLALVAGAALWAAWTLGLFAIAAGQ